MRKFYSCSVGEKDKGYDKENLTRIIDQKAFILHEDTAQKGVYSSILKGDILLLKYRGKFIAYGEALEIKQTDDKPWCLYAPIKEWYFFDKSDPSFGTEIYGMKGATLSGSQYGTVKPLQSDFSFKKIKKINKDSQLFSTIKKEFQKEKEFQKMQDKIDLLEYKKQIILQGPPGTGKTRLAKMIAEKMTNVVRKISPIDVLNDFFKNYTTNDNILKNRESIETLVNIFVEKFKPEEIANLSLEDYALGREEKDGFCYWLEYLLKGTGKYNGPADKGRIYFNSKDNKYIKSGFLQDIIIDSDAMKLMTIELDKIVNEKFDGGVNFEISRNFVLKILNTYYPETYFPINSEHCINNVLKIFGQDYTGLNYIEKNKKVQSLFIDKRKEFNTDITNYEFMYFLFTKFNLKKEVKLENNEVVIKGDYRIIQFHPSYSYEDFVRGITAKTTKEGIAYGVENRILVQMAEEAYNDSNSKYVLIIDEINRANLPSVLGELIYALEYRYNHKKENYKEASVESLYDIAKDGEDPDRDFLLPDNLYIIGTMNTSDRSVSHIDYAIRRRFAFVNVFPDIEPIRSAGLSKFKTVCELFIEDFDTVDWKDPKFKPSKHISSEFKPEDVMIGHSYFITKEKDEDGKPLDEMKQIELKLKYEIVPILNEYVKDGILKQSKDIETVISSL